MADQSDLPDWLKAMQPKELPGGESATPQSELPDWLRRMQPGEAPAAGAPATGNPPNSSPQYEEPQEVTPPREPSPRGAPFHGAPPQDAVSPFADLRQKAGAMPSAFDDQPDSDDAEQEKSLSDLQPGVTGTFSALRMKASSAASEYEEEQRRTGGSAILAVVHSFKPWQRFVLSLFLFLNISTMGCMILLMLGRIYF